MAQRFADIDPFASSLDGDESIGAIEAYGELLSEEMIGKLKVKASTKKPAKKTVSKKDKTAIAVRKASNTAKDISNAIDKVRNVTRSPITLAAIAATATVVPVGTVVAGIATAGLAVAEGIMSVAQPIAKVASKVGKFFKGLFGKKKKGKPLTHEQTIALYKRIGVPPLGIQALENAKRQAPALITAAKKKGIKLDPKTTAKALLKSGMKPALKQTILKVAKMTKPLTDAQVKAERETNLVKASKEIAKLIVRSNEGDAKAKSDLAAFQILARPDNIKNSVQIKSSKLTSESKKIASISYQEKFLAEAIKRATKMASAVETVKKAKMSATEKLKFAATKAKNVKEQKAVAAVAKQASKTLSKAVTKSTPKELTGVLVTVDRKLSKHGKFRSGQGKSGWLVDAQGLAKRGTWG